LKADIRPQANSDIRLAYATAVEDWSFQQDTHLAWGLGVKI